MKPQRPRFVPGDLVRPGISDYLKARVALDDPADDSPHRCGFTLWMDYGWDENGHPDDSRQVGSVDVDGFALVIATKLLPDDILDLLLLSSTGELGWSFAGHIEKVVEKVK